MPRQSSGTHHQAGSRGRAPRSARWTGITSLKALPASRWKAILLRRADRQLSTSYTLSNSPMREAPWTFSSASKVPSPTFIHSDVHLLSSLERTAAALLTYSIIVDVREQPTSGTRSDDMNSRGVPPIGEGPLTRGQ